MKARGFRFSFTPLAGVLFTFPSRYYALSVAVRIQPWIVVDPDSGRVPRAPPYSGTAPARRTGFAYGAVTLCGGAVRLLPLPFRFLANSPGHPRAALQPRQKRFGLLPVRSPLLGESLLISFPALLRWFTSRSVASAPYLIQAFGWRNRFRRVAPFGNPGIKGRSLLPLDFRGLPRPSSPDGPKASASGLLSLGHIAPSARSKLALSRKAFFLRFLFVFPSLVVSKNTRRARRRLLETRGFEPLTSGLQSRRSSQLSHAPEKKASSGKAGKRKRTAFSEGGSSCTPAACLSLRKEVIQPHLPVRLPCYDFTPLTKRAFDTAPLAVGLAASGALHSDGVTGGVYEARERIHRAVLMRDY